MTSPMCGRRTGQGGVWQGVSNNGKEDSPPLGRRVALSINDMAREMRADAGWLYAGSWFHLHDIWEVRDTQGR